jgi:hypothetical protein
MQLEQPTHQSCIQQEMNLRTLEDSSALHFSHAFSDFKLEYFIRVVAVGLPAIANDNHSVDARLLGGYLYDS